MPRRRTVQTMMVLNQLLSGEQYGLEVAEGAGLGRSTVYAILDRLQQDDLVVARPEAPEDDAHPGLRRYYWTLNGEAGRDAALEASAYLRERFRAAGREVRSHA